MADRGRKTRLRRRWNQFVMALNTDLSQITSAPGFTQFMHFGIYSAPFDSFYFLQNDENDTENKHQKQQQQCKIFFDVVDGYVCAKNVFGSMRRITENVYKASNWAAKLSDNTRCLTFSCANVALRHTAVRRCIHSNSITMNNFNCLSMNAIRSRILRCVHRIQKKNNRNSHLRVVIKKWYCKAYRKWNCDSQKLARVLLFKISLTSSAVSKIQVYSLSFSLSLFRLFEVHFDSKGSKNELQNDKREMNEIVYLVSNLLRM